MFSVSLVCDWVQKFNFRLMSFCDVFRIFTRNQVKLFQEISTVFRRWSMIGDSRPVWNVISKTQNHSSWEKIFCTKIAEKNIKINNSKNFFFENFIKNFQYKSQIKNYIKNSFYQEKLDFLGSFLSCFLNFLYYQLFVFISIQIYGYYFQNAWW